jgi:hypothetical protein
MKPITGIVKVDRRLFARWSFGTTDPRRDYGARFSLKIWPTLEGQGSRAGSRPNSG